MINVLKRFNKYKREGQKQHTVVPLKIGISSYGSEKAGVNMCGPDQKVQQNEEERKKQKSNSSSN